MSDSDESRAAEQPLPDPASASLEVLVNTFAALAERRGLAMDADNRAEGSRLADQLVEFSMELELRGESAALLPLLDHSAAWVRLSAAQECLAVQVERAGAVLEELSQLDGIIEVYARMARRLV